MPLCSYIHITLRNIEAYHIVKVHYIRLDPQIQYCKNIRLCTQVTPPQK
jgi:hypothetical protein